MSLIGQLVVPIFQESRIFPSGVSYPFWSFQKRLHRAHTHILVTMEPIMQMQDDIHKLKKMMDSVFEKMYVAPSLCVCVCVWGGVLLARVAQALTARGSESHSADSAYDAADAYGACRGVFIFVKKHRWLFTKTNWICVAADKDRIVEMLNRLSSRVRALYE